MNATVIHLGIPCRAPNVELRREVHRNVVIDHGHQRVHVLNDTAMALYELCDGETTPAEMVRSICMLFSAGRHVVLDDVERTLDALTRIQLLEWRSAPVSRRRA